MLNVRQSQTVGPPVSADRERVAVNQAHAIAVALDAQPVAIAFDFVQSIWRLRNLGAARGDARLILIVAYHGG